MLRPTLALAMALAMVLTGCGDSRAPSPEVFCADLDNLWSLGSRTQALMGGDGQEAEQVAAQLSATLESATRHAPDEVHASVVDVRESWEDAQAVLEEHDFQASDLPTSAEEEARKALQGISQRLDGRIRDWAEQNC